ncbi:ImmA/IrrE family metallo-endopeptidase [Mucilaginibacter sp. 44-25]|uniref:ImmA/IrrE family metallo-endopeptidase n=1 Tax=Mucilaginibacter sp. 44-25 TaxID=1895794 RepID=UPI000968818F|nr:ImmA/IrrE family metallo-endopeptidase [Mucilaginibacter sp. 44-25]OJW13445.1 MAG: hypothetical protein BGO48_01430 [Mucilaginibacter sp. 44-25]
MSESENNDELLAEIYRQISDNKHPSLSDLINNRKDELGITTDSALAKIVGIERNTLRRILSGENEKADVLSLLKISSFIGIDLQKVVNIYLESLKPDAQQELRNVKKSTFILQNFDLVGLRNQGFLKVVNDLEYVENRILKFFGLKDIYAYKSDVGLALFSRANLKSHDQMREMWVRCAYYQFKKLNNPYDYEQKALEELLPRIRPYTRHVKQGFYAVLKALYNSGITVIVQDYFSKTQVYGATFVVNNKPCIVITNRNNKYPTLWQALLHELYHVLHDFDELKTKTYHLSGEADMFLWREDDANFFASELLFPTSKLEKVRYYIKSNGYVEEFAKANNVHPSIIYNTYCRYMSEKGENHYPFYSKYIIDSEEAISLIKSNPWDKETLIEEIENIKQKLETLNT